MRLSRLSPISISRSLDENGIRILTRIEVRAEQSVERSDRSLRVSQFFAEPDSSVVSGGPFARHKPEGGVQHIATLQLKAEDPAAPLGRVRQHFGGFDSLPEHLCRLDLGPGLSRFEARQQPVVRGLIKQSAIGKVSG